MTLHAPCTLCPRCCRVVRARGAAGFCAARAAPRLFRYGPHFGEEPPLTGSRGSGTLFFSHCTLSCLYCQNHPWSHDNRGEDFSIDQLTELFRTLAVQGCHNWNLVSPTPWLPPVREALAPLLREGVRLPLVWNTSGYEATGTLAEFADIMDVALCDLRYASNATALAASQAGDYVDRARETLSWFWARLGPLRLDAAGLAQRGVICRLLILPGHAEEAVATLHWLADNIGVGIHISLMAQYTPAHRALAAPWHRPISRHEYDLVTRALEDLGFENGWVQDFADAPPADLLGCAMPPGHGSVGQN